MKLTKEQLKQIIKEELAGLSEALPYDDPLVHRTRISSAADALSRLTGVLETDAVEGALSDKDRDILREIRMWVEKLAKQEVEEVEEVEDVEGVEGVEDTGDTEEVEAWKLPAPRLNKDGFPLSRSERGAEERRRKRNKWREQNQ